MRTKPNYKRYITAAVLAALLQGAAVPRAAVLAAEPEQGNTGSVAVQIDTPGQAAAPVLSSAPINTLENDSPTTINPANEPEKESAQANAGETDTAGLTEEEQEKKQKQQKKARYEKAMEGRVDADHSAEYKPIVNEYLREGEGIPGNEVPYYGNMRHSRQERKEMRALYVDNKHMRLNRQKALKERVQEKKEKARQIAEAFKNRQEYSITFDPAQYTVQTMNADGTDVSFRAYEHLIYVKKPYHTENQRLNLYIPEAYFHGGFVNGFTAATAPIFMPNSVGGYLPGEITEPAEDSRHEGANAVLYALSNGYVVAAPAIRGRSLQAGNGYYTGKAPASIVDYKAAVRYVRQNRKAGRIPAGDTEKIIAGGTSAGGALAALLGAAGNAAEYDPYLRDIGAANERDDIFAVMAYCPITNLENADMAYEWMFNGETTTQSGVPLTEKQKDASLQLKNAFPEYLNSLNLRDSLGGKLNLSPDGDGIFKEYIESLYLAAAQDALDTGEDLSQTDWITLEQGEAVHMDFAKYKKTVKRLKDVPAFDSFDNNSGENNLFGTAEINNRHFTRFSLENSTVVAVPREEDEKAVEKEKAALYRTASPMEKLQLQQADLLEQQEKDKLDLSLYMADAATVRLLNPMSFIGRAKTDTAPHWRIRHGVLDRDTALAIPAILAVKLKNSGKAVDFKAAWGYGHDGDYDLPDLFAWTDRIAKIKDTAAVIREQKK